jgi:hypothetical protein
MADLANRLGIIGAVGHTYWTWSGNITGLFYQVIGAAYQIYPIAPLFLLTIWTVAFTSLSHELLSVLSCENPWPTALIAGIVLTLAVLSVSPNLFQALYWVNGTANYAFPTAITVGLIAVIVRVARLGFTRVRLWLVLLFTLIAAGGQATTAVFVTGSMTLALLAVWWLKGLQYRGSLLQVLLSAFLVSVMMSLIVALTPGNDIRQAALLNYGIERQPLPLAVVIALIAGFSMLLRTIVEYGVIIHSLLFVAALSLGFWLQPSKSAQYVIHPVARRYGVLIALLVGWSIFTVGVFPSAFTLGRIPEARTWIVPQMAWLVVVALAGYISGLNFRAMVKHSTSRKFGLIGTSSVLVIFGLHFLDTWSMAKAMQPFALDHDIRIERIEMAIDRQNVQVKLPPFKSDIAQFTLLDPLFDQVCIRQYYELESIITEPDL